MITGTAVYRDGSKGSFSFENWESLIKLSQEEKLTELRLFRKIEDLDCEIRKFEKEFNDDYTKEDIYFRCEVGFCESLGEQGFIYTFFYDELPTEEEIKEDVLKYIKEQIKELNEKLLSGYEEKHLEAFERLKI